MVILAQLSDVLDKDQMLDVSVDISAELALSTQ